MSIFNHHAYFAVAGKEAASHLVSLVREEGFKIENNPDLFVEHFDNFGIEEARNLKEMDLRQAADLYKVFIISFDSITSEAQNALLKTVEEPAGGSHFFFIISSEDILLPTLRSRLLKLETEKAESASKEAKEFLKMPLDERLLYAHKFSDEIKKEKRTKKEAIDFLNSVEDVLSQDYKDFDPQKLKKFLELKSFAPIRGSSVKMIMESAAILLS
jgi:hypothetical protein